MMNHRSSVQEDIALLKTVKERVEWLLERYKDSRNNDFYLTYLYWKYFDGIPLPYLPWDTFYDATPIESVGRARRIIQNDEGRYPPTTAVAYARWQKNQARREAIKYIKEDRNRF